MDMTTKYHKEKDLTTTSHNPTRSAWDNKSDEHKFLPNTDEKQKLNVALENTSSIFIKLYNLRVYLFSAIGIKITSTNPEFLKDKNDLKINVIIINAWEHTSLNKYSYRCCFRLLNGTVTGVSSMDRVGNNFKEASLNTVVYQCPFKMNHEYIVGVLVVFNDYHCSTASSLYLIPYFPKTQRRNSLAVCSQVAYGNLNILALIEWLEMQKFLGVDKILNFLMMEDMTPQVMKVFRYYESTGLVWLVHYGLPEKDLMPKEFQSQNDQSWANRGLTVSDCHARLSKFQYVAICDKDEIILPDATLKQGAFKKYLVSMWEKNPEAAIITFKTQMHILSWEKRDTTRLQYHYKYNQCSRPVLDRPKNAFQPSRIVPVSCSTHFCQPLHGYTRIDADPEDATIHHFREARTFQPEATKGLVGDNNCETMSDLANRVTEDVENVIQHLKLIINETEN